VNAAARVGLVLLTALVLQVGVVVQVRVFEAMGDLMLLLAVAAAVVAGPERGAVVGFAAGIAYDLLLTTPFGLSALAYCLAAYGVGVAQEGAAVLRAARWVSAVTVGVASALGVALYALLGAVVGQESMVSGDLPAIMAVVGVTNLVLGMPAVGLLRWAMADPVRHRVFAR
jgi:rod shape-determining protein MreD